MSGYIPGGLLESGGTTLSLAGVSNGSALVRSGSSIVGTSREWGIAATSTPAMALANTTAATAGATVQMTPALELSGTAWASGASASVVEAWRMEALPATGATVSSTLRFMRSTGGGAYAQVAALTSSGIWSTGYCTASAYIQAPRVLITSDGGGVTGMVALTNATIAAGANPATLINVPGTGAAGQVGWMKIYIGTTAYAVPYWAAA